MKFVPNAVTVKVARQVLIAQKHSPKLLFVAGLVGMGATVVLACKATLEVDQVLTDHEKQTLETISDSSSSQMVLRNRVDLAVKLGKLYAPAVVTGALTVAAFTGSHNIMSRRNAGLAAAYGVLEKSYSDYRERVTAEIGREKEEEIYRDVLPCEIEDENGKKIKTKRANIGGSPYAKLFDPTNVNFSPLPESNFVFLKLQQRYANDRLQARGHVFLNEIYDELGFERTPEGAVTGWVKGNGDGFIDFGLFLEGEAERVREFMIGIQDSIWLDFNVDGTIYDKI